MAKVERIEIALLDALVKVQEENTATVARAANANSYEAQKTGALIAIAQALSLNNSIELAKLKIKYKDLRSL